MTEERERDEPTGTDTTGHEWDGVKELDTPLPRWWLWIFYATIAWSIGYWILMPAWPGLTGYTHGLLHNSSRAQVVQDLQALAAQRGASEARLRTATLEQIEADPKLQAYALAMGQSIFGDNCATCHGRDGTGGHGYANLRNGVWLWGGTLEDIAHTITVGVRSDDPNARFSQMPAFGRDAMLPAAQIDDLTEYVVALSHRPADAAAVSRGAPLFQTNCAVCHGLQGQGNQAVGAPNLTDPNLTDSNWLYGADRAAIRDQIWNGRGGVMPAWGHRFDDATLKALAVYIHVKSGGGQ
jgi:cytochrome c oxidase cbb3-type subunit 3